MGAMIAIRRLTKQFRATDSEVTALKSLDVDVAEGEFFVIVGASGSGKTTLLRCVAGLETPEQGEITIDGRVVWSDSPPTWVPTQQRKLGMVFQSYAVWPHLTVYENVALPLAEGAQKVPRHEVDARVREALRLVQLDDLAHRPATLLSGGQQQRVALARAIAVSSRLLLMDEPLSNLDARLREEVRGKIRQLAKRLGSTVLYVTHDQIEAMAMADKIALMRLGELLQVGSPMALYRQPRRALVAEFFGQVNWLQGQVIAPGQVETPLGRLRIDAPTPPGDRVLIGFRPGRPHLPGRPVPLHGRRRGPYAHRQGARHPGGRRRPRAGRRRAGRHPRLPGGRGQRPRRHARRAHPGHGERRLELLRRCRGVPWRPGHAPVTRLPG
jgi:ABC-type sugar transport system ATPase subunit